MSTEENIVATRRLIDEGFTGGNLAICDELISPDALEHQRGSKAGIEGTKDTIRTLRSWFSDFELTIVDLIASDDDKKQNILPFHENLRGQAAYQ